MVAALGVEPRLRAYAGHSEPLQRCSNSIAPAKDESDAFQRKAAFCRTLIGDELGEQEDWLEKVDSIRWVREGTSRLASQYDNDGRLDSNGKVVHERTFIDPLYGDTGDALASGAIDEYSLEVSEHPNVHTEIENLGAVLKKVGLNPGQRRPLYFVGMGRSRAARKSTSGSVASGQSAATVPIWSKR
jgi:hypothetical protein